MAIYPFRVTTNALGQSTYGFVGEDGIETISAFAISTFGFLWGIADIWVLVDTCEATVWTDCACSPDCD